MAESAAVHCKYGAGLARHAAKRKRERERNAANLNGGIARGSPSRRRLAPKPQDTEYLPQRNGGTARRERRARRAREFETIKSLRDKLSVGKRSARGARPGARRVASTVTHTARANKSSANLVDVGRGVAAPSPRPGCRRLSPNSNKQRSEINLAAERLLKVANRSINTNCGPRHAMAHSLSAP